MAHIGQFTYIWAKGAIKDIGKVLNISFEERNEITSKLDKETIDEALNLGLLDAYKDKYPELFEYASALSGLPKSFGMHPCGFLCATREVGYYNALEYDDKKDVWVLQGDMHTSDDLGLVKIDLLGLRTVDVIYDVLDMIGKDYNYIAPHNIDMNDAETWKNFYEGNTNLIFQFESRGMKDTLRGMHCDNINDLTVANALYRPGSMPFIQNYIRRKHGDEEVEYVHDDIKPILSNTYGVMVFQEQIIEIGRLAGLSNPDSLRKAVAKKRADLMAKAEPELKNGLMAKGWSQQQANKLWDDILDFAKYIFNKAHAAAYALTAYISMYLKTHHTAEFFTACINSYAGDIEKIVLCIAEAKNAGVKVRFDLWYNIKATTTCKDGEILLGIDTLRGFGSTVSDALCQMHASNPQNFIDIISAAQDSSIDKTQFQALITLGMFKEYGETGKLLAMNELYQSIYKAKVFSKNKLPVGEALIRQCARETKSQYRDIDNAKLFALACADIEDAELPLSQLLAAEIKYKGYVDYNDSRLVGYYLVMDMNTKYSPKMKLYSLADGSVKVYKTYKTNYEKQPFNKGSIIKVLSKQKKEKSQMIDGKWCKMLGEYEDWITNYKVKGAVEVE